MWFSANMKLKYLAGFPVAAVQLLHTLVTRISSRPLHPRHPSYTLISENTDEITFTPAR
jgi:hypothetical protein